MGFYSEKIFPWFLDRSLDIPAIHQRRARLVGPVAGDVLEIGFGTGATLPYYDRVQVRSLSVVEPSAGMNRRAEARIKSLGWPVKIEPMGGEALPFGNESFDYVISCLTLCTVADPPKVLAEIFRVLRPGGSLRFFEHVASEQAHRRKWQNRLTPLQRVIGAGCHLNRDTVAAVKAAGFILGPTPQQIEPAFPFATLLPVVEGSAQKPT